MGSKAPTPPPTLPSSGSLVNDSISMLGLKAKDKVTGFKGVISSVCFDLYGCAQFALTPEVGKEAMLPDGCWFDVQRVELTNKRVMEPPYFQAVTRKPSEYSHGAAEKPAPAC